MADNQYVNNGGLYKCEERYSMSNFGLNLRQLRKQNKVSQKELGDLLGLGQTTITNYEKGNRYPSLEVLKQMADYFIQVHHKN